MAPAGSVAAPAPPSVPSVSPESAATFGIPAKFDQRQRIFLIRPAAALATNGHGQFAARDDDRALALCAQPARHRGVCECDLARLALDIGAERDAFISGVAHGFLRRLQ